ncbi:hypothetical protein ACFW2Y_25055 [Streptomyces sp. NPDC058877]|uniref:hypothetical protein n=1 Tax=Streptomyces sp. NPDC058877 TaxID=3346665 RepID=UPI003688584A
MAQVSGSALAAVLAAKLASSLGVYGTILGAGVISVVATCGGPLFQHLFKRTGEQVRDATAVKPKARQVPLASRSQGERGSDPDAFRAPLPYDGEFGEATTHGTRVRGWKRPAIAAALVFGVTMGGITAYELVAGRDLSGTRGTTTFGSVVHGGGGQGAPEGDRVPAPAPSDTADGTGPRRDGSPAPGTAATPTPGGQEGGQGDTGVPSTGPSPSASSHEATTPAPTPTGPSTDPGVPTGEPTEGADPTGTPSAPSPSGADAGTDGTADG